jgi:hypothetical protein
VKLARESHTLKPFNIGFRPYTGFGPGFFNGSIDEVALYNTTLTAAQIRELYDVTLNGRTALYANGRRECSFANTSSNQLSSPATNLTAGSTAGGANFWTGLIADLRAYVTSSGAYPGGFVEAKSNYDVTADRYRVNPLGTILRTNLALNLDAANARSNGVAPFANGCSDLTWYSIMTPHAASLSGFTSCGSSKGWNGDGTTTISGSAGPYRLDFDGSHNWVETDFVAGRYSAYSFETWINTSNNDAVRAISTYRKSEGDVSMTMMINGWGIGGNFVLNLGKIYFMLDAGNIGTGVATTTNFNDGAWHHVVGTWQGVNGQNITDSQFKIYVDGQLQSTTTVNGGWDTRQAPLNTSTTLRIGAHGAWGPMQYVGSMGKAAVYKSALSLEEVRQNCNALKSRYAGSNCN